jgi:uncharacterized protein YbaR (Trm112 family)
MGESSRKRKLATVQCPECRGKLWVYTEAPSVLTGNAHRAVDEMRREVLEADAERQVRLLTVGGPYRNGDV